jgi:hypothetical protein
MQPKLLALSLALSLLLLLDSPVLFPLLVHHRLREVERPVSCPQSAALGPYAAYLDPCELPLLHRHGAYAHAQQTAHEGQGDIASFLYASGALDAYIFDDSGPVCLTRAFFAVGFPSLNEDRKPHRAVLRVEVDGEITLEGTVEDLFMRRVWEPAGFSGGGANGDGRAGHPALSPALTFNVQRAEGGVDALHTGYVFQTPVCAARRLRVSLGYPEITHLPWRYSSLFVEESWQCVATFDVCPVAQYFNVAAVRFPAALPPGWAAWNGSAAAPRLPGPHTELFSGARALRAGRAAGAGADAVGSGALTPGGSPLVLLERRGGGGVVTALTLAFPRAPRLLHSRRVLLRAVWDEGGVGAPHAWGAPLPPAPPPGMPVDFTAWGFADADGPEPPVRGGGGGARGATLEVDLEGLLGPAEMGDQKTVPVLKSLLYVGEAPPGDVAGEPELRGGGGLYLTLPMPFWRSARVTLEYTGTAEEFAEDVGAGGGGACDAAWRLSVAPPPAAGEGAVGYLQGGVRAFDMEHGMKTNVLGQATGVTGKLAFLSARVDAASQQFVEGDVRVWVDGSPTPAVWDSGWEDFFGGSHGYAKRAHASEALFAWDRVDPPGWGIEGANKHTRVDFWQQRLFGLDAPAFSHGFRVDVEGLPHKFGGRVRAAVLFYGVPAPPLRRTDRVLPGEEFAFGDLAALAAGGALRPVAKRLAPGAPRPAPGRHDYAVSAPPDDVTLYSLTSVVPSYGEVNPITKHKCFAKKHCLYEGTTGGPPLTRGCVLSLRSGWVAFTVAVDPAAVRVLLRRLVDVHFQLQRATLHVDGRPVKVLQSSDKEYVHLDTAWKVDTYVLPEELTRGRSALRIALEVEDARVPGRTDSVTLPSWPGRVEGNPLPIQWTEAQWDVLCEMPAQG